MNLSELIAAVGDANVRFQKIDDCAESMNLTKEGSRVTFVTPERIGINGFDKLGLVVWIDRDAAAKAVADFRRARSLPKAEGEDGSTLPKAE